MPTRLAAALLAATAPVQDTDFRYNHLYPY